MVVVIDHTRPTRQDIDDAIELLIANEIAGKPDPYDFGDYYECIASSPDDECEGVGYGLTVREAAAMALITARGWLNTIPTLRLREIDRHVPEDWVFETGVIPLNKMM